jgi:hypothetical protein
MVGPFCFNHFCLGAGKTTLLHMLKFGRIIPQDPTQMPIREEFTVENLNITAYDMGGHVAGFDLDK